MISGSLDSIGLIVQAGPKLARLKKATDGMQTAFVKTIVAEMEKAAGKEFQKLPGGDVYQDMVNDVLAQKLSDHSNLGIGDALYKQMSKLAMDQEQLSFSTQHGGKK